MITIYELRTWAAGLDPSGHVGIDEGGLTLVHVPAHDRLPGAYLEVGGCDEDTDPPPTPPPTPADDGTGRGERGAG